MHLDSLAEVFDSHPSLKMHRVVSHCQTPLFQSPSCSANLKIHDKKIVRSTFSQFLHNSDISLGSNDFDYNNGATFRQISLATFRMFYLQRQKMVSPKVESSMAQIWMTEMPRIPGSRISNRCDRRLSQLVQHEMYRKFYNAMAAFRHCQYSAEITQAFTSSQFFSLQPPLVSFKYETSYCCFLFSKLKILHVNQK